MNARDQDFMKQGGSAVGAANATIQNWDKAYAW